MKAVRLVQPGQPLEMQEVPMPPKSASALWAIRLLIAMLPAVLLISSIIVAWFYPLTRARHAEIQAELARRRVSA